VCESDAREAAHTEIVALHGAHGAIPRRCERGRRGGGMQHTYTGTRRIMGERALSSETVSLMHTLSIPAPVMASGADTERGMPAAADVEVDIVAASGDETARPAPGDALAMAGPSRAPPTTACSTGVRGLGATVAS
jgi:hypothetical protein